MGSFRTSDEHSQAGLRPLRVPLRREDLYREAREMVDDLDGWSVESADDDRLELRCQRRGNWLSGSARVRIWVEGPEGIPSSTLFLESSSDGGLLKRDRAVVQEFLEPFSRRVG